MVAGPGKAVRREHVVFQFKEQADLDLWKVTTDKGIGGSSQAQLSTDTKFGIFAGQLELEPSQEQDQEGKETEDKKRFSSLDLCLSLLHLTCEFVNRVRKGAFSSMMTAQRYAFRNYELEDFEYLLLRVKGDGNKYILSLKTENWVVPGANDDLWQTYFHTSDGIWEDIEIPLRDGNSFLLSWRGKLVEEQRSMNYRNLTQMSLAIATKDDEMPQQRMKIPFRLELEYIKAMNYSSKSMNKTE